jgi:transcriptional regulator NrdR family protein
MMICPYCEASETKVKDSTVWLNYIVIRKRQCADPECAAVFYTSEAEIRKPEAEELAIKALKRVRGRGRKRKNGRG